MNRAPTEMELRCAQAGYERLRREMSKLGPDKPMEPHLRWDAQPQQARDTWIAHAHAIIRAMRELTPEMVNVGEKKTDTYYSDDGDFADGWRAAIDIASPPEL